MGSLLFSFRKVPNAEPEHRIMQEDNSLVIFLSDLLGMGIECDLTGVVSGIIQTYLKISIFIIDHVSYIVELIKIKANFI